jgi:penicillin-binding protein A
MMKQSWKEYQAQLQRESAKKTYYQRLVKFVVFPILIGVAVFAAVGSIGRIIDWKFTSQPKGDAEQNKDINGSVHPLMDKINVRELLDDSMFINLTDDLVDIHHNGRKLHADTSLDVAMQQFMLSKLDRANSRYIGIVAMDPTTGRVLAMIGFDRKDPFSNPCVDNRFPAASVFKIITATAGIEKFGFTPDTTFAYNGGKYTLYKSQLKNKTNRYSQRITFRDSFAQSVNPVFGKIGVLYLKKSTIEQYAEAFGFNRAIDFEIPFSSGIIHVTDKPYHWAEIASGFNRETLLSPLHGALLSSALLNSGKLPEPTVIDRIIDENGQMIYRNRIAYVNQACTPDAAKIVKTLMTETIRSGTCKDAFKGYRKDPIFSKLSIGGKSGSIANKAHDVRFDWFVGFAEQKKGAQKLVVSVVVGHEEYIGIRASRYARMVIKRFFSRYLAQKAAVSKKAAADS